jgi:hypothetical protein
LIFFILIFNFYCLAIEIEVDGVNQLAYKNKIVSNSFYFNDFAKNNNCSCDLTYTENNQINKTKFMFPNRQLIDDFDSEYSQSLQ